MASQAQQIEPKVALDRQIAELVREMLSEQGKTALAERVNADSSFERDLGLGSLDLVELVVRCESKLEIAVPDEVAEQADTPAGWARAILQGGQEAAKSVYRIVPPPQELAATPDNARTIIDALRFHADTAPDRIHIHVLAGGSGEGQTCGQLLEAAGPIARGLIAQGIRPQDRIAIVVPPGREFFEAFIAVLLAGAVPIPLYPPGSPRHLEDYAATQGAILRETSASALIIPRSLRPLSRILRALAPDLLGAFDVKELGAEGKRTWIDLPGPTIGAPAYIQMTAGATGQPRPVTVSHETLLTGIRALGERLELRAGDAVASCQPLASGFGLAGAWLFSLYYGLPLTYLSPREFNDRPEAWLWSIHNSKATISMAPNSVYEACARRVPLWAIEGMDLRSWRCAVNVGELVRRETVEAFTRRLGYFGFRRDAMMPAYGLAEAGGLLTVPRPGPLAEPDARGYFSLGEPLVGQDVRTVEGQVEFRSPIDRAWIATGDLGHFENGALTVTGRTKEALQRGTQWMSPNPLEAAASRVTGILPGRTAAFVARDAKGDRLIIAAESGAANGAEAPRIAADVRNAVAAAGEPEAEAILIPPGSLPRTGDGKIRRLRARELFLRDQLGAAGASPRIAKAVVWCQNLPALTRMGVRSAHHSVDTNLRQWQASSAAGAEPLNAMRARKILDNLGQEAVIEGELTAHALVVVHRCGPLDPVAFAAFSRVPLRFAGDAVLVGTPDWLHASLRPLIANTEQEMKNALEQGVLIQFPDNDLGEPPERCRFRLAPFRVAERAIPAIVQQLRRTTTIRFGKALTPADDAAETRDQVRAALARLRHPQSNA